MRSPISLAQYLADTLSGASNAESLAALLLSVANTSLRLAALVSQGSLSDMTGKLSSQNVQGETQMQLDLIANQLFIQDLTASGLVAGLVSEEMDNPLEITAGAPFLVAFDPLDGSSNIAVNVTIGSIFSVLNAPHDHAPSEVDYLQAGKQQLAAAYVLYGPSTMFVLTVGKGTCGFTLDRQLGEYVLTHAHMRIPETCAEFAINASNVQHWEAPIQRYVEDCQAGEAGPRGRAFNMRWVASLVADIHRILIRGGVYLYPKDNKRPTKAGRLRLLYEVNPMGMLIEQAGGKASTGRKSLLEVAPSEIHQRLPMIAGSQQEVALIERYYQNFDTGSSHAQGSPLFAKRSLFHKNSH